MKKSILLGSAAALVAVTGAQAADLPIVEPVDYVRVCDAFGAGFHYIPGTETCLKFSGRVRTEIGIRDDDDDDTVDTSFLNSNFELVVNASSMTEVGMLVGQFAISGSNEGDVALGDAWITIGENILVGRETSRYDFGGGYGIYDGLYVDEGINQFTFIMPFGNGLSMTLGLEDGRDRRANIAQYNGASSAITVTSSFSVVVPATVSTNYTIASGANLGQDATYAGMEIPEIVASLRISQGWGSAQISGALHQIRSITTYAASAPYTTLSTGGAGIAIGALDEDYGWAVQAGVELNVGSMTKVKVVGAYADGAMHYIGGSDYYEAAVDATTGNITDTMSGWYALASLNHAFSSALNVSVLGAYHDFDDQAKLWQVSANIEYEVVENLIVSLAGQYTDTEVEANTMLGVDDDSDTDSWEAKLRIQRNF
ncbi:porin [Pararhizobium sp. IMCC21322]|uniref:porin n=1 Tax=Pararhizobium sp. IMCC21322 TaxID=3067903 RepID=UPI0027426686|nr:porin [Pararhizobium sp. IMCC21322]